MAPEKVSRKMVLEIKYVNANNTVIHTENLVNGILAKLGWELGFEPNLGWELGFGTPPSRPSSFERFLISLPAEKSLVTC